MAGITETIAALKSGVTKMSVDGATKNIEMWEKELKGVSGAETIVADLGKLKSALRDEKPDSQTIKELMGKLASGTKSAASNAGAQKPEVEQLGMALKDAA